MVIIGFSDIITNSSSEIYCVYSKHGISLIKDIVNSILKIANSKETFDSLFEIKLIPNEYIEEDFIDEYDREPVSEDELIEYALGLQGEGPVFDGISVTAKDEKNKEAAHLLSYIDGIFQYEEYYT